MVHGFALELRVTVKRLQLISLIWDFTEILCCNFNMEQPGKIWESFVTIGKIWTYFFMLSIPFMESSYMSVQTNLVKEDRIIASENHLDCKRASRSPGPTVNPALPRPPPNQNVSLSATFPHLVNTSRNRDSTTSLDSIQPPASAPVKSLAPEVPSGNESQPP